MKFISYGLNVKIVVAHVFKQGKQTQKQNKTQPMALFCGLFPFS